MDISKYTIEDFVLDPEFRKWVLTPNAESNLMWENLLAQSPSQYRKVELASEILLNLSSKGYAMSESENILLWENIDRQTPDHVDAVPTEKVIPLNSEVTLKKYHTEYSPNVKISQFYRIVAILVVVFGLGILLNLLFDTSTAIIEEPQLAVFEEHSTPPGVKSTLTLHDGSKVILNSGSTLKYAKNFEADRRVLFLEGEAYFEVAKDPERPFTVTTGEVRTTALGTSFNISAYKNEDLNISLLTGKVAVDMTFERPVSVLLEKGEGVRIEPQKGNPIKSQIDRERVIGWTQKKILFEKIKLTQAIRILENWYGVTFNFKNSPDPALLISGKFHDETLENVLEGLSYTARFNYEIKKDTVNIKFN